MVEPKLPAVEERGPSPRTTRDVLCLTVSKEEMFVQGETAQTAYCRPWPPPSFHSAVGGPALKGSPAVRRGDGSLTGEPSSGSQSCQQDAS